jgi:hypothetical protein
MPSAINCPSCKRVLNLPPEAMNRLVQCPACKHQFHPAGAQAAEAVRPALPRLEAARSNSEPTATPLEPPPPSERRAPAPPAPPPVFDVRRSDRRSRRENEDLCPQCRAFVPRGVNKCPECHAEFEAEDGENYRPWEQEGVQRRDSEPHRGTLLLFMSIASMVLACTFFLCYIGIATTIVGLVLSIATMTMGRGDLRKMDQHIMNADGRSTVSGAVICGMVGLVLNGLGLMAAIALLAIVS